MSLSLCPGALGLLIIYEIWGMPIGDQYCLSKEHRRECKHPRRVGGLTKGNSFVDVRFVNITASSLRSTGSHEKIPSISNSSP